MEIWNDSFDLIDKRIIWAVNQNLVVLDAGTLERIENAHSFSWVHKANIKSVAISLDKQYFFLLHIKYLLFLTMYIMLVMLLLVIQMDP